MIYFDPDNWRKRLEKLKGKKPQVIVLDVSWFCPPEVLEVLWNLETEFYSPDGTKIELELDENNGEVWILV